MKALLFYTSFFTILLLACAGTTGNPSQEPVGQVSPAKDPDNSLIIPEGKTLETRFSLPAGFERVKADSNSFAAYLRKLPLKPNASSVKLYNGDEKRNDGVYVGVVDLPIGNKDLHQCADAVMRLKAEYHYSRKEYDKIHFNFTNGFRCDYSEWRKGKRLAINGNKVSWKQSAQPSDSHKDFWTYMEMVFSYAGSLSLSKEMESIPVAKLSAGDVFILGGSPGHAVIVVDVATSDEGRKIFMLAQSYMPAQETQILANPNNSKLSPWYSIDFGSILQTPEWEFTSGQLMRFKE